MEIIQSFNYRNDPKFSDRQVWANSADADPDIIYNNTKPDIVISVIFTQNEDLVVTYWNIE